MGKKKKIVEPSKAFRDKLGNLEHAGTKEAVEKLRKLLQEAKTAEERDYARMALDECEYFYYSPDNPQEESDFRLARLLREHDEKFFDWDDKAEAAREELERLALEKKVHDKVMASKDGKKNKGWQENDEDCVAEAVRVRLAELEAKSAYEAAWITEARGMIKTEKFKFTPFNLFQHVHLDCDGVDFWRDYGEDFEREDDNEKLIDEYET